MTMTAMTVSAKGHEVSRQWYVIDATDQILGRLSTEVARRLRGKHKPEYTSHVDVGDFVIVLNAEKIRVTGRKFKDKKYYHHTRYPGGIKEISFDKLQAKHPEQILEKAIKGMLPKTTLGRAMYRKLKVYAGNEHPHVAQQPVELTLETKESDK